MAKSGISTYKVYTKSIGMVLAALLCVSLLVSCDFWRNQEQHGKEPGEFENLAAELSGFWDKIDGSTVTIPLTTALFEQLGNSSEYRPAHNTTSVAYERLIQGKSDLIFVTYPSEDEFEAARQEGIELVVIPIVKDALVFLVNSSNPVNNITHTQLLDIYAGKTTGWNTIGGLNMDIIPYQRPENSGSQTLFLKLVMGEVAPLDPPIEWLAASMDMLVEVVSVYDNAQAAIGYSMFYYVNNMYGNSRIKLLGVDGVKPTRDSISAGEYPYEDFYYAVIRKDTPADSPARKLIDWILTEEGQALAVRAGYIPLQPMEGVLANTIDPVYLGETEFSRGTGGTTLKNRNDRIDLVVNGVRKPLSDVFFDGFNYIEFINSEITRQILSYEYPFSSLPMEEQYLMRSYTGIPNDYPNYEVRDFGLLVIHFPMNNPFFENQRSFTIRLTEEISPYGEGFDSFTSTYHYARRMLPAIDLFTCDIKLLDLPDAAARINGQLRVWTDGFPLDENTRELLEEFASWRGATAENPYRFQPIVGQWQQYLSVSYVLLLHVGPSNHMPLVYTKCFDMTTGNEISLVDALPGDLPYKDMMFYIPIRHFEGSIMDDPSPGSSIPSSYIPDEGSVISIAWLTSGSLGLIITEPSGRELQTVYSGAWS